MELQLSRQDRVVQAVWRDKRYLGGSIGGYDRRSGNETVLPDDAADVLLLRATHVCIWVMKFSGKSVLGL